MGLWFEPCRLGWLRCVGGGWWRAGRAGVPPGVRGWGSGRWWRLLGRRVRGVCGRGGSGFRGWSLGWAVGCVWVVVGGVVPWGGGGAGWGGGGGGVGGVCWRGGGSVLSPWGWAVERVVRGEGERRVRVRPRRARCAGGCGRTHVLLPVSLLSRRVDLVEVIGAALVAVARGMGVRRAAGLVGRPVETVRGWVRRLAGR